jgi:ABC-2 type transport system ATP-binding protein
MHRGKIRALGTPRQLKDELATARGDDAQMPPPSLEDVFRHFVGSGLDESHDQTERFRDVRRTRRTASRVG